MTTPTAGALTLYARELLNAARARGGIQRRDLRNGARISVLVVNGQVLMTFSRPNTPLGDPTEIATFVKHCEVPFGAERRPAEGQSSAADGDRTRYYVTYVWPDNAQLDL